MNNKKKIKTMKEKNKKNKKNTAHPHPLLAPNRMTPFTGRRGVTGGGNTAAAGEEANPPLFNALLTGTAGTGALKARKNKNEIKRKKRKQEKKQKPRQRDKRHWQDQHSRQNVGGDRIRKKNNNNTINTSTRKKTIEE